MREQRSVCRAGVSDGRAECQVLPHLSVQPVGIFLHDQGIYGFLDGMMLSGAGLSKESLSHLKILPASCHPLFYASCCLNGPAWRDTGMPSLQ